MLYNSMVLNVNIKSLQYVTFILALACSSDPESINKNDGPCINDLQMIGSHNSYKLAVEQPLLDYVADEVGLSLAESIEYEHISFEEQLDLGIRCLELDVFNDPDGGYYANPQGLEIITNSGFTPLPYDEEAKLSESGLKLFHVQDVDFRSHHLLFTDALQALKNWSDNNPTHSIIIVLVEAKDEEIDLTISPIAFDANAIELIDTEIKHVFSDEDLITPDFVKGDHSTLQESVLTDGWPTLSDTEGKFMFVLDGDESETDLYLERFPDLNGASLFVNQTENEPEAAFMIINDPVSDFSQIQDLVSKGYLVRTLADSETRQARTNDFSRFEMAKASNAQIISTDYYLKSSLFESEYQVIFEDGTYYQIVE